MGWWESKNNGVIGDSVADLMTDASEEMSKEYNEEWDRKPTIEELIDTLNFVGKTVLERI